MNGWRQPCHQEFAQTIQIDDTERICLSDIGYFQTNPISDGELLDEWLQIDLSKHYLELQVFKRLGRYYTTENMKLWTLKTLKMFSKNPETKFTRTHFPFEETNDTIHSNCFNDSLKFMPTLLIGGSIWKNIDYLKRLPTLEIVKLSVSDIYFTKGTIPDAYENKSIARLLADSYAAMKLPRVIRVVKFGEKCNALDNEILWVVKEMQRMRGSLEVSVEIKIEMDPPLFRGFMSENIQEVTIEQTNFSHTNEETFIFECMKKIPPTLPLL